MPQEPARNRSRSRSRPRELKKEEERKPEGKTEAGSKESDIVNVAIKQLTPKIRERLEKLFNEGLLKENDLDLRSVTVFASLNEGLQDRVMTHMENERIYVANARSKSGFLIATCDKAKTGCLDARGLGAIDPWRPALVAMAAPKQKLIELEPEREWLDKKGSEPVKLHVNVVAAPEVGKPRITVELPLTETAEAVKSKLAKLGIESIPANKMKLFTDPVGFLKDRYSLAFYNLADGTELELSKRIRGGAALRKDHAVPLKRPKTHERQASASAATASAAAAAATASKPAVAMPSLPALPSLAGLPLPRPAVAANPAATAAATAAANASKPAVAMPSLPALPSLAGLPLPRPAVAANPAATAAATAAANASKPAVTMPGLPALPGLSGPPLPNLPGLPGMPGMMGPPGMGPPGMGPPGMGQSIAPGLSAKGAPAAMPKGATAKGAAPIPV